MGGRDCRVKAGGRRGRECSTGETAVEAVSAQEEDGSLDDWTEEELAGECSTGETAVEAVSAQEEGGSLDDWTEEELAGECKTLGLSDEGTTAVLISRTKEARESAVEG